jgi:molybdate transport system permease protein
MTNKIFNAFLLLILIVTALFLIAPLFTIIWEGTGSLVPSLASEETVFAIRLSLKTTVVATLICMLFSVPASYRLYTMKGGAKKMFTNILYLPMSLPHLVSGMALLLLYGRRGIGNFLENCFNIDFIFTESGIVLALVFVNLPFAINMVLAALEESNSKMVFVARTLGCNEMQAFFRIILPSLQRTVVSAAVMTWSRALGEFGAVVMVAGSTRLKTEILPPAIYLNMATGDIDLATGISVLLILISFACLLLFELLMPSKSKKNRTGRHKKPC